MSVLTSRGLTRLSHNLVRLKLSSSTRLTRLNSAALFHSSHTLNAEGLPVKMPSLSPTMMEGTIIKWLKKEGDPIQPGDVLCDIQTDKAVVAMDTDEEGTLAKILVPEDTKDVKVGTLIAVLAPEGEDWKTIDIPAVEGSSQTEAIATTAAIGEPSQEVPATGGHGSYGPSVRLPSVRLLLEKYGLTAEEVPAGGPHGVLLKGDVLQLIKERNLQPLPPAKVAPPEAPTPAPVAPKEPVVAAPLPVLGVSEDGYQDLEITNMRRTIAKRLSQSKGGIAHAYGSFECRCDQLVALRKQYKAEGINVSMNDFIIKAVAVALMRCPEMNCVWQGDQLTIGNQVDISVAVATPAGLITPIVHGADTLGLEEISACVRDLAGRAKENKLKPEEFIGGTFTISNLGMFGISEFSAIINPPQCGILAVGGSRVCLAESGTPALYMSGTLSYDRSGIDDDTAAYFLETLKQILENPSTMVLGAYSSAAAHPMAALL